VRRTIDLDQVRVVQSANSKGNPWVYLEVMDVPLLYADVNDLARDERWAPYVTREEFGGLTVDVESLADLFRLWLGRVLVTLLLKDQPSFMDVWMVRPGREVRTGKPRLEEDPLE
jgi:hypothetical protein